MIITLKLDANVVNLILAVLAEVPYKTSAVHIHEIQKQMEPQMEPQMKPQAVPDQKPVEESKGNPETPAA